MMNEPQYSVKETRDPQTCTTCDLHVKKLDVEALSKYGYLGFCVWLNALRNNIREGLKWLFSSQATAGQDIPAASLMPSPRLPHRWWCVRVAFLFDQSWTCPCNFHCPPQSILRSCMLNGLFVHRTNLCTWTSTCVKALDLYHWMLTFVTSGKASRPPSFLRKSHWCRNTERYLLVFLI